MVTALSFVLVQAACATSETGASVLIPPLQAGRIDLYLRDNCPALSGKYVLLGKLISGRTSSPIDLELENVLGAPIRRHPTIPRTSDMRTSLLGMT